MKGGKRQSVQQENGKRHFEAGAFSDAVNGIEGPCGTECIGSAGQIAVTDQGITYPQGFFAAGTSAGLKEDGALDMALVLNKGPDKNVAAVFTSNAFAAAPVLWSAGAVSDGRTDAVVLNSGGANACTGKQGFATAQAIAEKAAAVLGLAPKDVAVCSTGIIGQELPKHKVLSGIEAAAKRLAHSRDGGREAAAAIMTTDTVSKQAAWQSPSGYRIGSMAKGAGMLAPELATMLVVLTTDAAIAPAELRQTLKRAADGSFNCLDSDGCMSTNDTVLILASGASGVRPASQEFLEALTAVCRSLAWQLADDAEGARHTITVQAVEAATDEDARKISRAVCRSNLFKTAVFGQDPNWGRILSAIGTTDAAFEPGRVDVSINGNKVCCGGCVNPQVPREQVSMEERHVHVEINLNTGGKGRATILTNDLTYDYVRENSVYGT